MKLVKMKAIWKISICFSIYINTVKCCDCNLEVMIRDTVVKGSSNTMDKRQNDEYNSAEIMRDSETTEETTESSMEESTEVDNHIQPREPDTESDHNDGCPFFKAMPKFNHEKMVDVWRIAYYKASEKLSCFKIHLKKTTLENREIWHQRFGDFNGTIDWKNCQFEVASTALKNAKSERRHFLEGSLQDNSVFKNVIVTRDETGDVTMLEQSPDQWLVVGNLLLMRDCDNGDVVVFSRLPMEPSLGDIEHTLSIFGEDASNGTWACETLMNPKYQTLS